jgi:hypothetical protein
MSIQQSNAALLARAAALVQVANIRNLGEYGQQNIALMAQGKTPVDASNIVNNMLIQDAGTAITYLNEKIDKLAAEKETKTGTPVKTIEVDWLKIKEVISLTDSNGQILPVSITDGIWIANSYVAPLLKAEARLAV